MTTWYPSDYERALQIIDKRADVIDKNNKFGPIFVEDVKIKEGKMIFDLSECYPLKKNEVDYYPGLTLENTTDGRSIKTFKRLDADKDGVLSSKELKSYEKYKNGKTLENESIEDTYTRQRNNFFITGMISVIPAILCRNKALQRKGLPFFMYFCLHAMFEATAMFSFILFTHRAAALLRMKR